MRKIKNALGEEKLKKILEAERTNALGSLQSSDLSAQRIRAYEAYMGKMDDLEVHDGESRAVSSDVQDVVEAALPIIVDALTSTDNIIEFKPTGPNDVEAARQETDYVNHVFFQQNDGFLILLTIIKDGLLSKNGFAKWSMEPDEERERENYEGLSGDAYALLEADDEISIIDKEQYQSVDPLTQQPITLYDCRVETVKNVKRPTVWAMPPEEVLISKNSSAVQDLTYWAHASKKAQADIIARFEDKEDTIRAAPSALIVSDNSEENARQTVQDNFADEQSSSDVNRDMRMIEVTEHYIRLGLEADKIARRYKITALSNYEILDIEEVPSWPMATGTPVIMPHRLIGRALADLVLDVQEIKTSLLRATLNNAYYANNARTEVSETHASENTIDDLLNNRVGGIVRTKMPGGLQQLETTSIGHWTLPLIEHMNETRDGRTGVTRYNQGLDADSLNHTATGITRIMDAAEMRMKLMTRVFAETLLVNMFRGIHEMLQRYSERKEEVELRGEWVTVNPREWKTRRHMKVNLPLGGVGKQQMNGFLMQLLGIQKEAMMQQGGPNGPLVSYQNVYATADQLIRNAGLPSVQPFFMKPAPPNPNAPPSPDPKMVEAQGKMQLAQQQQQQDQAHAQVELQAELQSDQLKAQFDQQQAQQQFAHQQALDKMKFDHDAKMKQLQVGLDMRLEAFKAQEAAKLNAQQAKLSARQGVGTV